MTETESIYSKSYQMLSKALTIKCNGFNELTLGGNVLAKLKRWNVNSKFHRVLQPYDVFINNQKKNIYRRFCCMYCTDRATCVNLPSN